LHFADSPLASSDFPLRAGIDEFHFLMNKKELTIISTDRNKASPTFRGRIKPVLD